MLRTGLLAAVMLALMPSAPSFAVSQKDKMATCKFGADDKKLAGAARDAFMKKCMSNQNDPRGASSAEAPAPKN